MEFTNNRILLFGIGVLTIALAIVLSVKNIPKAGLNTPAAITGKPEQKPSAASGSNARSNAVVIMPTPFNKKKLQSEIVMEAGDSILYAQKAACRMNVSIINSAIERWYLMHDDQWPKNDLSDIGRDVDYFPSGIPTCPVDGTDYFIDPITHRIAGHLHPEIPEPQYLQKLQSGYMIKNKEKKEKKEKNENDSGNMKNKPAADEEY